MGWKILARMDGVDQLVLKVKDTINRLYIDLAAFMVFNIRVFPSTASPPPEASKQKKWKWIWGLTIHELRKCLNRQLDLERYLSAKLPPYVEEFDNLGWWNINIVKYHVLREITNNILTISISTIVSEFACSSDGAY